jgi:hypothetical protein
MGKGNMGYGVQGTGYGEEWGIGDGEWGMGGRKKKYLQKSLVVSYILIFFAADNKNQ